MKHEPFSEWQINFTTTSGIEDFFTGDEDEYNEKFQDLIDNEDLKYVEQCVRKDYVWDEELENWVEDWVDVLYDTENYDDYIHNKSDNAQYESKYEVNSYYDYDLKGLEDYIYTNDWNEVETFAHEKLMQGNMIKIINKETGKEIVVNSDDYIENFDGEFTVRPEQLDESKEQKVTYNIYVLEGGDGVYNSVKVGTVDSEEQAEDRVAELQAETGSNAYYKKVINGKVVEDISEEGKLVDKITDFLEENDIYGEVDVEDNKVSILIEWGDWKHDHLRCDDLMKQLGYERVGEEVTEEDGSDCYSAIRYYRKNDNFKKIEKLDKNDNVKVKWFEHRDYGDFRADIIQGQLEDERYFTSGDIDNIQVYKKGYNAIQRLNDKAVIDDEDEIEKIANEMANNEDNISQEDLDYINNYIYNISQEDNLMESKKVNSGLVVCDRCLRAIRSREEISDEDIEEEIPDRYVEVVDNDTGTELGYCMWCGDEYEVTDLYYIKPDKKTEDLTKYGDSNPDKVESDARCEIEKLDDGYYIKAEIGDHTNLGSGKFSIYPENYIVDLYNKIKALIKEDGIEKVKDKIKKVVPEYNALIPEYNKYIEDMITELTPYVEKSKQKQITRKDIDNIESIIGKVSPNHTETLPEFNWDGKFGKMKSFIGNLKSYVNKLTNPLGQITDIYLYESKVDAEEFVKKVDRMKSLGIWNGKDNTFKDAENKLKDIDNVNKEMKIEVKKVQEMEFNLPVKEEITLTEKELLEKKLELKKDYIEAREKRDYDYADLIAEDIMKLNSLLNGSEDRIVMHRKGYTLNKDESKKKTESALVDLDPERYEEIKSKQVLDSDGFYTDYTMYYDKVNNSYVFVFGDIDLYEGTIDHEEENKEVAEEWFDSFNGFEELGESKKTEANKKLDYKLDNFDGVNIVVVDKKNGIDTEKYMNFDSMEFGIDEYEFKDSMVDGIKDILTNLYEFTDAYYDDVFTVDEITEMAEDITQDVLQLYDDLPEEKIDRKNGYANIRKTAKKTEAVDTEEKAKEVKEKVEKEIQETGKENLIDTENELVEGIKKEIYQFAKQQGLDLEKLRKQGVELDTISDTIDKVIGDMVSKSAIEFMDQTGQEIDWDFDIRDNDIHIVWNNRK